VNPRVSLIVLNFNGLAWLRPCLTALAAQVGAPPFEVLVADNGSTDRSIEVVEATFPAVRVLALGRNLGFAGGNNAAAKAAAGELLVFLNNDTIPAPDWLSRLYAAHVEAHARDIVTSRLMCLDRPTIVDSAGDGYLRAGGAYKRGHGLAAETFLTSREVFGACGAAFLIPKAIFDELGGFDETFFMVYEDVDLCYRARLAGYACWYAADAVVRHAGSATLGTVSDAAVFHGQRNLEWTWVKNTPGDLMLRTFAGHALYSLAGLAHYVFQGRGAAALRGKMAAIAGLRGVLARRRAIQHARRVGSPELARLLDRGWIRAKRREKAAR
jgi:GT2 family glycosyltransferase